MSTAPGRGGPVDVGAVSPIAQDYVKAIWTATEWGDPPITTKALAARFGTSAANVSETMRRLAGQGLLEYERYRPVTLTPVGTRLAVAMVRRHRLIETFLVSVLGYDWDDVHDEAERLEHAATDALIERIDRHLGHPASDPHGDPIPDATGRTSRPADAVRLAEAPEGEHLVRRVSDAVSGHLALAARLDLRPGCVVTVARTSEGLAVRTGPGGTHPVMPELAEAIWVTPSGVSS